MKTLERLIVENEDWLVDRVVYYAVSQGFSENTSTLREAWRASICGLSGPVLDAIAAADATSNAAEGFGRARETIVAFGVEQALRHRARGVKLTDFLGLLKYYRRAYLDLIDEKPMPDADGRRLRGYILDFFDQVEIGLCGEWNSASDADRLSDLQDQARSLTNEKNKYLTIFESIREPVILLDTNHHPTHLNHAAHHLFCGDVAPGASYYGASNSPLLNAQVTAMLDGASEGGYDTVVQTLSGPREFNVHVQNMLDISHKFDGTVIILNDVSEYKRALRRAEAADHAKSTFLAAMSHEIRTPIAGVLGLARLLSDTELSCEQAHHVDGIISSGELLAGVVGNILDFSQAEVGGRQAVPEDFDLSELVRQVLMVVERPASEKGLALETSISTELPARLRGDTSMIRQVLLNLSHNAVKFTEAGGIEVCVTSLKATKGNTGWVRFQVIDTGVGLPEGPRDWLFDPFTQHDGRGDSLKGGVGLGLAICRKIVASLGGQIGCSANPAGGSIFQVDLPLEPATSEAEKAANPSQPVGARVLVVDDDEVNRAVAEGFLEKLGHVAISVSSAPEALEQLGAESFDLVLSDNRMPGVSGLEMLAQIRALNSGPNSEVPIVIVTASVGDVKLEGPDVGAPDGVLGKPYDTEDLSRAIRHLLPDHCSVSAPNALPKTSTERESDIDLSILNTHVSHLGLERSQRVIETFTDSAPARIRSLQEGISKEAWPEVSSTAHALAGAAGALGLAEISRFARDIETRADKGDETLSNADISRLETRFLDAKRQLAEWSKGKQTQQR